MPECLPVRRPSSRVAGPYGGEGRVFGHADVVREALVWFCRPLMEGEVAELIGAGLGERSEDRATWRNGYRPRRYARR